jgi:hypothetical protein
MSRCKKKQIVINSVNDNGITDKYCVVWDQYQYRPNEIRVYFNGHSPEDWGFYWKFVIQDGFIEASTIEDAEYLDVAMLGWQKMIA